MSETVKRTREELQKLYLGVLADEGYAPELDSDGDVRFKHEGKNYFIEVREDDPFFFRVVLPNFWEIESDEEHVRAIRAANAVTGDIPVAKVFGLRGDTWCAVEMFLPSQESFEPVFNRCLLVIQQAVNHFTVLMREGFPR
jgi:hypothetical protein